MAKEISINEIAKQLGVSSTTVSRTLSGKGRVSAETQERIKTFIRENDFLPRVRPDSYQERYLGRKTKNICVTLPAEEDFAELPYFQQILLSIYDYCAVRDYNVILAKVREDDFDALKKLVSRHKIDGAILTRTIQNSSVIQFLQEKQVPFVVAGSYDDPSVYQVDVNQENGCRELTSILIGMGMRKIGLFCADMTHMVTKSRYHGFLRAFQEQDLSVDTGLIYDEVGYPLVAEKALEDAVKEQVECIICMDDNICLNVLNKLRKENVRIPQDIKIASFYNSPALESHYPPITCLEFDTKELGRVAAKMLLELLNEKEPDKKVVLGYKVILKESTK